MRRDEEYPHEGKVRFLHKKYKIMDYPSIRVLFEFCEYDIIRAEKVLFMYQDSRNPISLIKTLMEKPEKSEEILDEIVARFNKQNGEAYFQKNKQPEDKKDLHQHLPKTNLLNPVPNDLLLLILNFLPPYSQQKLFQTCKKFNILSNEQYFGQYYRKICSIIFSMEIPRLPDECRFVDVQNYVMENPLGFSPNVRNCAATNLRYFVWKMNAVSFRVQKDYYLDYGSYYRLFKLCPRIHYNGYYVCRYKYLKIGEKTSTNWVTPIHVIYYYRYIRFLNDGTVLYHISTKPLKSDKIMNQLSINQLKDQNRNCLIGQYMQYKDKVYMKASKINSIFSYQFTIDFTDNKIANELMVVNYTLQIVDQKQIVQNLYKAGPHREPVVFVYQHHNGIEEQNQEMVQACSL